MKITSRFRRTPSAGDTDLGIVVGGVHGEPGELEKERGEIRRIPHLGECRGAESTQEQETEAEET